MSGGKRVIECNVEIYISMVALTKQKAELSTGFPTAKGNLEREQEVEDTMLDRSGTAIYRRIRRSRCIFLNSDSWGCPVEDQSLDENLPSVVTDAKEILWQKIARVRPVSSAPNTEGTVVFSLMIRKIPICKKTKHTNPGVG